MKTLLRIAILFILLEACGADTPKKEKRLKLVKTSEVVLSNMDPPFGSFLEVFKVSNDGSIFIFFENIKQKVFVFDNNGNRINILGKSGKGPAGIERIAGFDFNNESDVIIYDTSQRMIKIFSLRGELLQSFPFMEKADFGIIPYELTYYESSFYSPMIESKYVMKPEKSKLIAVFSKDGKVKKKFGKLDSFAKSDNNYSFNSKIAIDRENNILYSTLSTSPFIQSYNLNTYETINYFGKEYSAYEKPKKEITRYLSISEINKRAVGITSNLRLYVNDKYIIQHVQVLTKKWMDTSFLGTKENLLVLYDKSTHKLVQVIPAKFTLGAVRDSKFYFVEDFNPDHYTIGIYEIQPRN